jgi:hypothetical protein
MRDVDNPFSPGAGTPPPELAGRSDVLHKALVTLARVKAGRSEKSVFLVGLRGVGKTVLLYEIQMMAEREGYKAEMVEARENKRKTPLPELLLPCLRKLLLSLDRGEHVSEKVKQGLRVLKSFVGKINFKIGDIEIGIDPAAGVADSGDLEIDLAEVFVALGEAAKDRNTAVALIIDELQYVSEEELSALIMAVHKVAQKGLPLVVIGAGLPQLVGKSGRSKSYAERLFDFPKIGALSPVDAKHALQEPVREQGVLFSEEALDAILEVTQCYPYFLQEWGYWAWNVAETSPIGAEIIPEASRRAITSLDAGFFRVRFERMTPKERLYVRALAELGSDPQRSGDVANLMGMPVNSVAPLRSTLIQKGMIYSPAHGDTAFTVPLFDEFLKRTIPDFPHR